MVKKMQHLVHIISLKLTTNIQLYVYWNIYLHDINIAHQIIAKIAKNERITCIIYHFKIFLCQTINRLEADTTYEKTSLDY
jgi:hypothetical protein